MVLAWVALASIVVSGDLGQRLDTWLRESEFKGGVLVARKGEIVLRKGYNLANRENGIPYGPDTVFTVGSITKQFTAAAILISNGFMPSLWRQHSLSPAPSQTPNTGGDILIRSTALPA